MKRTVRVIKTIEEFKIFADPYRMKIIDIYNEFDRPMTAKMVADEMGEVPAKVHYHVKKLLKINILVPDHIEIINGINAKYYRLKDSSFRLDFQNDSSPEMKNFQVDSAVNILIKNLDSYKSDVYKRAAYVKANPEAMKHADDGFITYRKIFLTNDEALELKDLIVDYIDHHSHSDDSQTKYAFIAGIIRNE